MLSSQDLTGAAFESDVVDDLRVWVVEFYSPMCGSCQEFASIWDKVDKNMKSILTGKVNIDETEGAALAKKLGVLDEGLPNIRLFNKVGDSKGVSIMNGDSMLTAKAIMSNVRNNVLGYKKRDDGYMIKGH